MNMHESQRPASQLVVSGFYKTKWLAENPLLKKSYLGNIKGKEEKAFQNPRNMSTAAGETSATSNCQVKDRESHGEKKPYMSLRFKNQQGTRNLLASSKAHTILESKGSNGCRFP